MSIVEQVADFLGHIGSEIVTTMTSIERSIGLGNDALHVLAGVLLQLAAAFILRSSLRNYGPWLLVLALVLASTLADFRMEAWPRRLGDGSMDIVLTMFLPTILLIVARKKPNLLTKRR